MRIGKELKIALVIAFLTFVPFSSSSYAQSDDFLNIDLESVSSDSGNLHGDEIPKGKPGKPETVLLNKAEFLSVLTIRHTNAHDLDSLWSYYIELRRLAYDNPRNVTVARRQAAAIVAMARMLENERDPFYRENWSEALYRDALVLTSLHPKNAEIALRQAETAAHLAAIYRNERRLGKIPFLYEEMHVLTVRHPKDTRIIVHVAEIAENAMIAYRNIGDFIQAEQWLATLVTLVDTVPQCKNAAAVLARAARMLSASYSATGEISKAMTLYETVRRLHETSLPDRKTAPGIYDDNVLAVQHALTLPPLIAALLRNERLAEAETLYRTLSEIEVSDADIALAQAEAAGFLTSAYKKIGDSNKADALVEDIRQLRDLLPLDADRIARLAGMADIVPSVTFIPEDLPVPTKRPIISQNRGSAFFEFRYVEMKEKLEADPADAINILRMAEAMSELSRSYLDEDRRAEARSMYMHLARFVRAHPNNISVARQQMAAAVNLATGDRVDESETMYKDARALSETYPRDLILSRWRAQAALNLGVAYMKEDKLGEMRIVREDARKTLLYHPDDTVIVYWICDITRRILIGHGKTGDNPADAADCYTEVMEMSAAHVGNDRILLLRAAATRNFVELHTKDGYDWNAPYLKKPYAELKRTVKDYKGTPTTGYDLAVQNALAARSLLSAALKDNRLNEAKVFYQEIAALNAAYPNKSVSVRGNTLRLASPIAEIVTAQAYGALDLASHYDRRGKTAEIEVAYKDAGRLLSTFIEDKHLDDNHRTTADETRQEIAVQQARIGEILIAAYRKSRTSVKAEAIEKDIVRLAGAWPDNIILGQIKQNIHNP